MTEFEPVDWQQRLADSNARYAAARDERRQTRRGFDARRDLGLERRQGAKAARLDAAAVVDEVGTRCHYLVSEAPARACPNERLPGAEFCRPHMVRAVELARRLGLIGDVSTNLPPCCAEAEDGVCPQHQQAARVVGFEGLRRAPRAGSRVVGESGRARPVREDEGR